MPRTFIYRLFCLDPLITDEYVGSTTNLANRRYRHKNVCNDPNNNCYNLKVYQFVRANGGWDNWRMDVLEEREGVRWEINKREGELIEQRRASLNSSIPGLPRKEGAKRWRDSNQDHIKEYRKEYYKHKKIRDDLYSYINS